MMEKAFKEIKKLNKLDKCSTPLRLNKVFEESGELAQAVNKLSGRKNTKESKKDIKSEILEEGADTIQCVLSLLAEEGFTYKQILSTIEKKNKKWRKVKT